MWCTMIMVYYECGILWMCTKSVDYHECGLLCVWYTMNVVYYEGGILWVGYTMSGDYIWVWTTIECGLLWVWTTMSVDYFKCGILNLDYYVRGLLWVWTTMSVDYYECGILWVWTSMWSGEPPWMSRCKSSQFRISVLLSTLNRAHCHKICLNYWNQENK